MAPVVRGLAISRQFSVALVLLHLSIVLCCLPVFSVALFASYILLLYLCLIFHRPYRLELSASLESLRKRNNCIAMLPTSDYHRKTHQSRQKHFLQDKTAFYIHETDESYSFTGKFNGFCVLW